MERAEFNLVVHGIDERQRAAARGELARLFRIDSDIADDILGAAPIILVRELTLGQARVVRQRLRPLAELGVGIVLSNAPYGDSPKVNWPEPPEIARVSAAEEGASPPEEVATFRCPGCGDTLQLVRIARGQRRRSGRLRPEPPARTAPAPAPAPAATAPARPSSDPRRVDGFEIPGEVPIASTEPAPPPEPVAPAAALDEGPLVRALQEKRVLRESQRLQQAAALVAGEAPTVIVSKVQPAPAPAPGPQASAQSTAPPPPPSDLVIDFGDSDAFDRLLLDEHAAAPLPERSSIAVPASAGAPGAAPVPEVPAIPSPEGAGLDSFDVDEALRLLDDAPPVRAAPAPPPALPSTAQPSAIDVGDFGDLDLGTELEFGGIDSDIAELEAALARGAEGARDPDRSTRPDHPIGGKRGSSGGLQPLDATEALAILGAEGGAPSDDLLLEPAVRPVSSDELIPLDPNEALEILTTNAQRPAAPLAAPAKPRIESEPILSVVDDPAPPLRETKKKKRKKRSKRAETKTKSDAPKSDRVSGAATRARRSSPGASGGGAARASKRESKRESKRASKRESGRGARPVKRGLSARRKAATKRVALDPADDEPVHGLVLSKITSDAKRTKAAEIITDLTSLNARDAQRLTDRTIIPVLKGVSRKNAEEALRRFQKAKISGRVTTRRLGR